MERLRKMYITPYFKKSVSLGHLTPRYKLSKTSSGLFSKLSASSNSISSDSQTMQSKRKLDEVPEDQQQSQQGINNTYSERSEGISNRTHGEANTTKSQNHVHSLRQEQTCRLNHSQVQPGDPADEVQTEPPGTDAVMIEITINEGAHHKADITVRGTGRLPTIEACTKVKDSPLAVVPNAKSPVPNVKKQHQQTYKNDSQAARANGELPKILRRPRRV